MNYVAGCVTKAKRQYTDPLVMVTGDFNQWKVEVLLADSVDMSEVAVGPTRQDRCIDRIFVNFAGTVPPLETDDQAAKKSGHLIAFAKSSIPLSVPFNWLEYSYWYYNEDPEGGGSWRQLNLEQAIKLKYKLGHNQG